MYAADFGTWIVGEMSLKCKQVVREMIDLQVVLLANCIKDYRADFLLKVPCILKSKVKLITMALKLTLSFLTPGFKFLFYFFFWCIYSKYIHSH